jgi:hypothetical protein
MEEIIEDDPAKPKKDGIEHFKPPTTGKYPLAISPVGGRKSPQVIWR